MNSQSHGTLTASTMEDSVLVTSPNLIHDKDLKRRLQNQDSAGEIAIIMKDILSAESREDTEGSNATRLADDEVDKMQISLKVFLRDFSTEELEKGISRALDAIGVKKVDSVTIAVPYTGINSIGLGNNVNEEPSPEQRPTFEQLMNIWRKMETYVEEDVIQSLGLCDVQCHIFKELYEKANVKPKSVQVNLKSCCVVPPDLAAFAKEHNVRLITHSDPPDMMETAKGILQEHELEWQSLTRYQIHIKDRGVLRDKRYLLALRKNK